MTLTLKLTTVGNSVGATFSKEVLSKLKVGKGDTLFLTESPDGFRLTPYNPDFETQMNAAQTIMRKRRNALRELAK